MDPVSATSRVVGPLPAGTPAPKTEGERALYEQAKQFEAVFVRQLVSQMLEASRGESETPGSQIYQGMADEQMTGSLVDSGAFGLAGAVYGFLRTQASSVDPATMGTAAAPTPPTPAQEAEAS